MKKQTDKSAIKASSEIKITNNKNFSTEFVTKTLTNGFFTVNNEWTVKYWNKAAEIILGIKSADIVGHNLWKKFAGVIPLELYAIDQNTFMKDVPVHFEEYWGEMGAWFDVITYHCDNTLSVSFKSSNHRHTKVNTEERLQILTELYRYVTEMTNDCLWERNLSTDEIFWIDGGHKRTFGYQVENALIPRAFWESRIHPDDKERVISRLKKILTDAKVNQWEDEYMFQKANGEYAYVHDRGHIIYTRNKTASRIIGATSDITEKKEFEARLAQEKTNRQKEITEAIIAAQENERAGIVTELHENLNHILAASRIYIELAKQNDEKREAYLEKSSLYILQVIDDLNNITKKISVPGPVIGLTDSIQNSLNDLLLTHPYKIEFYCEDIMENTLDERLQVCILRIIQEQLENIVKHAYATNIYLSISRADNEIKVFISDNGIGCNMNHNSSGVGIINIKSRAEMFNGKVSTLSNPGEGYDLKVLLQCN